MLNPRVLLTLAFAKMLYDNSRKMGNPVPLAPCPLHQSKKSSTMSCFLRLDGCIYTYFRNLNIKNT